MKALLSSKKFATRCWRSCHRTMAMLPDDISQYCSLRWWRRYCWTVAGLAVGLTSLRAVLALPLTINAANMQLPPALTLPGWQQLYAKPLYLTPNPDSNHGRILDQRQYELINQKQWMSIKVTAIEDTNGDVATLVQHYLNLPDDAITAMTKMDSGRGSYGLMQTGNRYYLTSCLHADGHGTLTAAEYASYAGAQLMQLEALGRWMIGQQPIPDHRCWWVVLETTEKADAIMPPPELLRQVWDNLPDLISR